MDNITAFIDNVGRTIIGQVTETTDSTITVTNPAIVNMTVQQDTGQISVQLLPYIFVEFVHESVRKDLTWIFNKNTITQSPNIVLDDRIVQQYSQIIVSPPPAPQVAPGTPTGDAEVVKLFDDE